MEDMLETVDLDVDTSNELSFKVKVEGASSNRIVARLVCDAPDCSFMFAGRSTSQVDVVEFLVPTMKGKLAEGTYPCRVEVLVDSRYFAPVQFQARFKQTVSVVAESLVVKGTKKEASSPVVTVTNVSGQTLKERRAARLSSSGTKEESFVVSDELMKMFLGKPKAAKGR